MTAVLFIGGARSGKSRAAASLAHEHGGEVTTVVFGRLGVDDEFDRRIADHQMNRPETWRTIEAGGRVDWLGDVSGAQVVLIDCIGTWLSGLAEDCGFAEAERVVVEHCSQLLALEGVDVVIVSNEVGSSLTPLSEAGRSFTDSLGRINQFLGTACGRSYLCVAGFTLPMNEITATPQWRIVE